MGGYAAVLAFWGLTHLAGHVADLPEQSPSHPAATEQLLDATALRVRECESGGDYQAENPASSASGAWQFLDSTWTWVTGLEPPASAWPKDVQDRAFLDLWDGGEGASHWAASSRCWEVG